MGCGNVFCVLAALLLVRAIGGMVMIILAQQFFCRLIGGFLIAATTKNENG